ncbi:MAG: isoprenylcysteine carboxylmethyltransferase family protein [Rhodanobacteraceae bacterium]
MNPFSLAWLIWLLIWLAVSAWSKRSSRREGLGSWFLHMLPLMLAAFLLAAEHLPNRILEGRMLPYLAAYYWIGLALTIGGLAFAVWARLYIGSNWSASVQVKADHQLVRTGPYRFVRHPIYTGMLAAFLGSGLAIDEWRGLVAFVVVLAGFWYKLKLEERWMIQTFGEAYIEYRKHTSALVPGIL